MSEHWTVPVWRDGRLTDETLETVDKNSESESWIKGMRAAGWPLLIELSEEMAAIELTIFFREFDENTPASRYPAVVDVFSESAGGMLFEAAVTNFVDLMGLLHFLHPLTSASLAKYDNFTLDEIHGLIHDSSLGREARDLRARRSVGGGDW